MIKGKYKIAGVVIEIQSIYQDVHDLCKDYSSKDNADITVSTVEADISFEREKYVQECKIEGIPVLNYTDGHLETLSVYRKMCEQLLSWDLLLFHGSAVSIDGESYLFTAKSGTGKSTHTRMWRECFPEKVVMVNDDKPLLKITDNVIYVCGTPWNGKHNIGNNISAPLKAICILERSEKNSIHRIGIDEAYPMLLQQSYKPKDVKKMEKTFILIDEVIRKTKLFKMGCNISHEAAIMAYNAMKEG